MFSVCKNQFIPFERNAQNMDKQLLRTDRYQIDHFQIRLLYIYLELRQLICGRSRNDSKSCSVYISIEAFS